MSRGETLGSPGPIEKAKLCEKKSAVSSSGPQSNCSISFSISHLPLPKPALFLSNGGFSSHLEASPELRLPFDPGQLPSPRARHGSSESHKPLIGSGQMGLPRSEKDNSTRSVAPEDRRRRLRGAKRGLGGTGQGLRRSLRLARVGPPRRSQ